MSNITEIKDALEDLILNEDRAFVAMLSGEWGIGKTYFWKNFKEEELKEKKVVDVSLFGCSSLQEIEERILTGLYSYNNFIEKYAGRLNLVSGWLSKVINIPIQISAGSILSMFKSEDFENIVICLDDFERLSDKVSLKDVMGLISQFKEDKKCQIIMILNEGELSELSGIDGKPHDEIFALYKEKIVDYNFHYLPSQEELFEAIAEDIAEITFCEHQTIYDFFKKIDLKNIRIMKQSLYLLKQFSFIESKGYDKKVIDAFVEIALNLFRFKAESNYSYNDFKDMRGYITEEELKKQWEGQDSGNGESSSIVSEKDRENSSFYYDGLPYRHTNERMEALLYDFLDNFKIDKSSLYAILDINAESVDKDGIREEVFQLANSLLFELSEDIEQIIQKLYNLLVQNKSLIPHIIKITKLHEYFIYIKEYHPKLIDEQFIDSYILSYYDMKGYISKGGDFEMNSYIHFIEKYYPHLKKELNEKIIKNRISKVNIDTISALISKVQTGWSPEDAAILNSIDTITYIQYIEESGDFFYDIIGFIKDRGNENDFSSATKHIKRALRELKKKGNSYSWRISKFLKKNNINIEEEE